MRCLTLLAVICIPGMVASQEPPPTPAPPGALRATELPAPIDGTAAEPNVVRGADGKTYLTFIERLPEKRHALRFSVLQDSTWSPPRSIAEGSRWFVNWADFPGLAVRSDGALAAHWREKLGEGTYAYGVRISCSRDGGKTWTKPVWLHRDTSETEHGFATLAPRRQGGFAAIWLDGRPAGQPGEMALRSVLFDADAVLGEEAILDPRVCECCCTAAAFAGDRLVAVYRDRSQDEIRDLSVVRKQDDAAWSAPVTPWNDGWETAG